MIKSIQEINFPEYATLSTATVSLSDMGDKIITTQVKIDGSVIPDFSYNWEVEFEGERYIQPLREPQASKGNESINSIIDLTFYHKTIYELKRYYFVEMASTDSGTAIVDKYIASLNVNLKDFCTSLQLVLDHYFNGDIVIDLNAPDSYNQEKSYIEINYSHIWDVLLKIYDIYGVRWAIEGNTIKIGYPTTEVSHIFEYGFEGGLLKVERQVQNDQIFNSLLGRGGDKNLPYRYFKDVDTQNTSFQADPDWIPELENIYFTNLRGKTFRDYVKGWKARHYGGTPMAEPTEAYERGYTDSKFAPIENVDDKESIAKYGIIQNGLDNVEDIFPTIQGVEIDGIGRVDEIVGAEQVVVDEVTENTDATDAKYTQEISGTYTEEIGGIEEGTIKHFVIRTDVFETSDSTVVPYLAVNPSVEAIWDVQTKSIECYRTPYNQCRKSNGRDKYPLKVGNISIGLFFAESDEQVVDTSTLESGTKYYIKLEGDVSDFPTTWDKLEYNGVNNTYYGSRREFATEGTLSLNYSCIVKNIPYNGLIVKSDESKVQTTRIEAKSTKTLKFSTQPFQVPTNGATNVNVPINITTTAQGLYLYETSVKAVDVNTREVVSAINIPQGEYYLEVYVDITNNSDNTEEFKVEMMSAYIILPTDTEEFKPTFDIWIKNIWQTTRAEEESIEQYSERVWRPILGDRQGNEAKVVFTSGWLAGHSDYEFTIRDFAYAGGDGVELDGIPAEWRLTLIKSDAEVEATGKWIPSTKQQAMAGDHFFFIGIDMPHQYVLWAEERLDAFKRDQLLKTANIKPTWIVQTDKLRLTRQDGSKPLLEYLKIGNTIRLADSRFINAPYEKLYLQNITYTWDAQTTILPNVDIVLAENAIVTSNPIATLQGEVDTLSKQVGSISNVQQIVRAVGDKLYLRKDGIEDFSNSPSRFGSELSSRGYRQGTIGGQGWGLRCEQGKGIFECDKLVVREDMKVNSLVVNQVSAVGGKEILSAASIVCTNVEAVEEGFKCYFDQKRGSVGNLFVLGDIAYSQVFDSNDIEVKYYKREVIEVGDNYILLSNDNEGEGIPQANDVIVQYGNTSVPSRQYVIIRDVIGGGYERMLANLNSLTTEGVEYYFAGRLEGDTPRWFVGNSTQFIEYYKGELRINAKLKVGDNFQDVSDIVNTLEQDIQGVESSIQSSIENLQNQIDGVVDSYFYPYSPTTDNFPANEWTTDEEKARHIGDTFTNINEYLNPNGSVNDHDAGKSWRWTYTDTEHTGYHWHPIADSDAVLALQRASSAVGIARSKVQTFVSQPITPYYQGDFWYVEGGRLMICITTRDEGNFNAEDWQDADNIGRVGQNLVNGTGTPVKKETHWESGYDWYAYPSGYSLPRPLEKGKTYTVTCQTTGEWSNSHNPSVQSSKVTLWISDLTNYSVIISDVNTSTGTTFVWDREYVEGYPQKIRFNTYGNPQQFWNLKIEEGSTATPWSLAPQEQSVVYHNSSSDEPIGVKEGDIWLPSDAPHTTYTYKNGVWVISGDSTGTVIDNGLITSGTIQLGDPQSVAKAGITGSGTTDKSVRIWAGNGESSKESAPFRVLQDGTLYATKANIEGRLNAGSAGTGDMIIEEGVISVNDDLDNQLMRLDGTGLSTTTENGSYNIVGYNPIGISGAAMQQIEVSADDDSIGFPVYALYIPRGKVCGLRYPIKRVTTALYTVSKTDTVILCSGSQSSKLYLPANAEDGQMYIIIGNARSGTKVEVVAATGQTIKGYGFSVSLYTITGDYADKFIYMAQEKMWYVLKDKENV